MESIFFRRLEPRRSTQSILPLNVTGLGGGVYESINPTGAIMPLEMMSSQYYAPQGYTTAQTFTKVLGDCPWIDSPGLQSVVGTMGDIFGGSGSGFPIGPPYGGGNWGGYNLGVGGFGAGVGGVGGFGGGVSFGRVLGDCPWIDSPGLQSVVGTMGDIYSSPYKLSTYNTYSVSNLSNVMNAYDVAQCFYIGGVCPYIGGGCTFFGGCMVIDPAPFTSIIGTLDSFQQY